MTQGEKLFIDGQLQEAYDVLLNEASEGSGRAMYLLGEYAKHGYIAPADKKLAKRYAEEGKKAGDLLAALNVGCQPAGDSYAEEDLPSVHASGGSTGKDGRCAGDV